MLGVKHLMATVVNDVGIAVHVFLREETGRLCHNSLKPAPSIKVQQFLHALPSTSVSREAIVGHTLSKEELVPKTYWVESLGHLSNKASLPQDFLNLKRLVTYHVLLSISPLENENCISARVRTAKKMNHRLKAECGLSKCSVNVL